MFKKEIKANSVFVLRAKENIKEKVIRDTGKEKPRKKALSQALFEFII